MTEQPEPIADAGAGSLLQEYVAELGSASAAEEAPPMPPQPAMGTDTGAAARNLEMVLRIPVMVKVVLGSATMPVANLVKLGKGAVIPLDRKIGEPVDVVVNGRIVARGEVVIADEATSRFGVKLTEVVGPVGPDRLA